MVAAAHAARAGAAAAARIAKKTIAYPSFTQVPAGTTDIAVTPGAGPVTFNTNRLVEGNSTATSGAYHSVAAMPDVMSTNFFSATVTNANASTTSRGMGAAVISADGTKVLMCVLSGNTATAKIISWTGAGTETTQASASVFSNSSSDTIELRPSVSGGVVTWTVYKNGVATALTWTDSGHLLDLFGARPGCAFRHEYSGNQFPGPGVKALTAADL